jgi:hypothetical protein
LHTQKNKNRSVFQYFFVPLQEEKRKHKDDNRQKGFLLMFINNFLVSALFCNFAALKINK